MTKIERFNLTWLTQAITDSPNSDKHYYYDSKYCSFFSVKTPAVYDDAIEFYDAIELPITGDSYYELFMRMTNLYKPADDILEIGRLGAAQKRDIQWQFLSRFGGHKYHFKYFIAVIDQNDGADFVLDKMMSETQDEYLFTLWERFKLEVVRFYINSFAESVGIELDLSA